MGDIADTHTDYPDDYDEEPHETECKFCGKGGLFWEDDNGKWVLINGKGALHNCRSRPAKADDFEVVG